MPDLTPETLAELRLAAKELTVLKIGFDFGHAGGQWRLVMDSMEALLDAAAERDRLREMVRSFGRTIDRWGKLIIAATASEDITTPDGDGDWQVIEERLAEVPALKSERDALAAKVERVRALPAKHPAGGWYMTSMRDVLAALDEEPQP